MRWYQPILYLWASPGSLIGLSCVPMSLLQGGRATVVDGVVEVHGGIVSWFLKYGLPWVGPGAAITFGHVVWGFDARALEYTRKHERVHVRQYERWGPVFIPAYLTMALVAFLRRKDPYRDNPFEREAFEHCR